jgi:hypothetical protein
LKKKNITIIPQSRRIVIIIISEQQQQQQQQKKSHAERQKEVDRQLEAMRHAIGDDLWSDSDSDDDF